MNDTRAFLNHLFTGVSGHFELTFIHPTRPKGENIRTSFYRLGHDRPDWQQLHAMNADGWGVYYGTTSARTKPAYGRRKETDAHMIACLWCEFDFKDGVYSTVEDVTNAIGDYAPPTVFLSSGGGVHALWRIRPVVITRDNRAAIKETLRGMAINMKADTSATDLARILRLPNTINTKPERNGVRCTLLDLLPGEYTLDTFAHYRHYAKPIHRPIERDLPRHRPDDLSAYVQGYLDTPTQDGQRNKDLNNTAFHMHSNNYDQSEAERVLLPKALADGLGERESLRTIQSAFNAPRGEPSYLSKRALSRIRAGEASERRSETNE